MYTPPAISPQVTPRSSESQASDEEEEEEEEEEDDETYHDADLGFRGVGAVGDSGGTTVPSSVASSAAVPMADESIETTADRSTTTATPTSTTTAATTTTTMAHAATTGGGGSSLPVVPPTLSHGGSTSTTGGGTPTLLAAAASVEPDPAPPVVVSASNLDAWKKNYREVAHTSAAVCWELSSSKPGNGVEQLRDMSNETYWQSDGTTQPHWVQITFRRRLPIVYVALYLDIALDESYTPKTLSVETGMTAQDLSASPTNMKMELTDPSGWSVIAISGPPDPLTMDTTVKTHLIRINILSMHQNGRDTHIRRLAIFAKRTMPPAPVHAPQPAATIPSSSQGPLMTTKRNNIMRGDDRDDDDDDDDTNLMLNSDFGGPFSMLIR
jgi:anaphase-promoting complex subunit 10